MAILRNNAGAPIAFDDAVVIDHAGQRVAQRRLSVAFHACDADDLAAVHLERERLDCAASASRAYVLQTQAYIAADRARLRDRGKSPPTIARAI